jgi:DNA-binding GntR family transcriptional regulator
LSTVDELKVGIDRRAGSGASSGMLELSDVISFAKPSLQVPSLSERVASCIESLIVEGRIRPGSPIIEETVARELGISRSSLREALIALENMGLIVREGRSRRRIRHLDDRDVAELYEMWAITESEAAAMACQVAQVADFRAMQDLLDEMDGAASRANRQTYHRHNLAFHQVMVRSCPNRRLLDVYVTCLRQIRWAWALMISGAGDPETSQREHRQIAQAYFDREADRVRALVRQHLSTGPTRSCGS